MDNSALTSGKTNVVLHRTSDVVTPGVKLSIDIKLNVIVNHVNMRNSKRL